MNSQLSAHLIGISSGKAAYLTGKPTRRLLPNSHSNESSIGQRNISRKRRFGIKMDSLAGIREHVSLAPKFTATVKGKLSLGTRILQVGGVKKVFKQLFSVRNGEKLLKASQCYLSTTAGPIAGLLFISTDKIAFCSERSIKLLSPSGKLLKIYYKVSIPLRKIKRVDMSQNSRKPSQKYIDIVTEDNFEFWFMGFLNHQKTLKYLQEVIIAQA